MPKSGATNGVPNPGQSIITSATYTACTGANQKWCRKPVTTTDANGVTTTYTYDTNTGNVKTVTLPAPGAGKPVPQTINTYSPLTPHAKDASGNLVNQPTVYRLTMTQSCMSSNWTGSACASGAVDERRVTVNYTANNLLPITTTSSIGDGSKSLTTTLTYNDYGWLVAGDGPKPGAVDETYTFYDPSTGRPIGTLGIDPDGTGVRHRQATYTKYDNDGHVTEVDTGIAGPGTSNAVYSGADGAARYNQAYADWQAITVTPTPSTVQERDTNEFDTYGRPVIARHFIGNASVAKDVTQRSYDNMQRLDCVAVRLNSADYGNLANIPACNLGTTGADGSHDRITKYGYDAITGDLLTTTVAYGTGVQSVDVTNGYNSNGTLAWVEDGKGNRTSYSYDTFNRVKKTCYPDPATVNFSSTTDCRQTVYSTTTFSIANATNTYTALYSRPESVVLRNAQTYTFGYDALSRTTSRSGDATESVTFDNFGQTLTHTQNGHTSTYVYNALGWLQKEDNDTLGHAVVAYEYDNYGKRTRLWWPDGVNNVTYEYDAGDELTGILENGTTQLVGFDYDDYGRRAHLTRANGITTTYNYDGSLRLYTLEHGTTANAFYNKTTYSYTAADQIAGKSPTNSAYAYAPSATSKTYAINGLNQIGSVNGGPSFVYALKGDLKDDGSGSTYTYDVNDMLTSATLSGVKTDLVYDAENRLYSIAKGTNTTVFVYDGADLIAEYLNGTLVKRYVHGPGADEPLVAYDQSGNKTWFHADDSGSVVLTTNASGAQVVINKYDEYGLPGAGNVGRFQYTGQVWLQEIGLYYYKARMYNPAIGRFMQPDAIGYGDGMNMYGYVHGDPVNGSDPTGLCDGRAGFCGEGDGGDCSSVWGCPGASNWFGTSVENYNYGYNGTPFFDTHAPGYQDGVNAANANAAFQAAASAGVGYSPDASLVKTGGFGGTQAAPGIRGGALGGLLGGVVASDGGSLAIQSARRSYLTSDYRKNPQDWVLVMRWYGGTNGIFGRSWTRVAGADLSYPRNTYGIPDGSDPRKPWGNNTMEFVAYGAIATRDFNNPSYVQLRNAIPYGSYSGGGQEVVIRAYVVSAVVIVYKWDVPWTGRK